MSVTSFAWKPLSLSSWMASQHVAQAPYDANRDAFLRSRGFRVLRLWNGDVFSHPDSVVETIFEALHRPQMEGRFD